MWFGNLLELPSFSVNRRMATVITIPQRLKVRHPEVYNLNLCNVTSLDKSIVISFVLHIRTFPTYMTTFLKPYLHVGLRITCRSRFYPPALKSAYSSWAETVREGLYGGSMAERHEGEEKKGKEMKYADVC